MGKKRNHCDLLNRFAKVCRKKLNNTRISRQDTRINTVGNSENTEQKINSENQNLNYINYNEQFNSEYDSSDDN